MIVFNLAMFPELEKKCKLLHQKLKSLNNYSVSGIDISPVKHLRLTFDNSIDKLEKIVDFVNEIIFFKYDLQKFEFTKFFFYSKRLNQKRWR